MFWNDTTNMTVQWCINPVPIISDQNIELNNCRSKSSNIIKLWTCYAIPPSHVLSCAYEELGNSTGTSSFTLLQISDPNHRSLRFIAHVNKGLRAQLLRPTVEVETVKFFVLAKCWWSRVKQVNCAVIITAATLFTL